MLGLSWHAHRLLETLGFIERAPIDFRRQEVRKIWGNDPRSLLADFRYQPELTQKLDLLRPEDLTTKVFYEIVLWKLNRFPKLELGLIDSLKAASTFQPKEHRKASTQLRTLLQCPGIGLPMASTVLRFVNPNVFQIIDDRVYRIIHPGKAKYPVKPLEVTEKYLTTSESIYFDYLDELHSQSCAQLPFAEIDRILYQLDIKLGNKIGDEA